MHRKLHSRTLAAIGALFVTLFAAAAARADYVSPWGTVGHHGLRYSEQITLTRSTPSAPGNYINQPLPAGTVTNEITGPSDVAALTAAASAGSYLNTTCWSSPISEVPADAPMVPVRLWQSGWATSGVPRYMQQLAAILADGVPIPDGWQPETCGGDTDNEGVFYQPDRVIPGGAVVPALWELWRLRPCDPATNDGFTWCAQGGGRMSYVSTNPGHWVNRTNGAVYPTLNDSSGNPLSPAKRATFEDHTWGATAAKLPRLELEVTAEDVQAGCICHALIFSIPPKYIQKGLVWPAQGYDGYATSGPKEGVRFRLPPETDCTQLGAGLGAGAQQAEQMVCAAARDYGIVLGDRGGSFAFYATPDVEPLLDGVAKSTLFRDFPFASLEELQVGSDSQPDVTG